MKAKNKALSTGAWIGIVIVVAIIVGAGTWAAVRHPAAPATVTQTVTSTVTTTATTTVTKTVTSTAAPTTTTTTTTTTTKTTTTTTAPPAPQKAIHKTVIYLIQNDPTTRVLTIKKGVADIGAVPPDQLDALAGTTWDGAKIIKEERGLSFDIVYIVLNDLKAPFNNTLVREALAYAVPYQLIWSTVYANTTTSLWGVIPKGMLGYTDFHLNHYKLDMNKAKQLIQQSGIDPTKYTITVYYNQGNSARAKIATLLSQFWGQLGFKVMVQSLSWPQLLQKIEKPEFDVYVIGWAPDYVDPDDYAGPMVGGGTNFDFVKDFTVNSASEVSNYLASAKVIETPNYYVVVGPAGTGAQVSVSGKPILVVQYKLSAKQTPPENCTAFVTIDPAFYRNHTLDALIEAGRSESNPTLREAIYNAVQIISNQEEPIIWLGQYKVVRDYWNWVHGRYVNPVLGERWDLVWETPPPKAQSIGIGNYVNDKNTLVDVTIGWPQSFDPAKSYETFGWAIFHQIGDTLVTYWMEDFQHPVPDAAVAWAHNANGTTWYFVIRKGLVAYDVWHNKTYTVNATDVLFSIWRIARLNLDPSWMISTFVDVNNSKVLTEKEFANIIGSETLYADYNGKTIKVTSLSQLLSFFGYNGDTAGVVELKLYQPYGAILNILADPFTMVIPAKYLFDYSQNLTGTYEQAMADAQWGKNPSAWAKYIGTGEKEPTHVYLHTHPIGTGPYAVVDFKQDSYIVLKLNPYYWNSTLWQERYGYTG